MKFLNTKTIHELIDEDNCLKAWGGNDNYVFKFEPEKSEDAGKIHIENNNEISISNNNVNMHSQSNVTNNGDGFNASHAKKVRIFRKRFITNIVFFYLKYLNYLLI